MDIYKEYLTGKTDFQTLYEELEPVDVYDMYAGEWVLSRPTHPEGNIRQTLKEDIRPRWVRSMERVQEGILAEGIKAIFGESKHLPRKTEVFNPKDFRILFSGVPMEFSVDDKFLPDAYFDYVDSVVPYLSSDYPEIENEILDLPRIAIDVAKLGGRPPDKASLTINNMNAFFDSMATIFEIPNWENNYGGSSWARITRELKDFWQSYPDNSFSTIDHVIDLAHNTDTWVDKFEHSGELLMALDIKFEADSPKDWTHRISDRKIRAGVKRAKV